MYRVQLLLLYLNVAIVQREKYGQVKLFLAMKCDSIVVLVVVAV